MSPVSYQLQLPHQWRIHPVFHIDLLMPYRETKTHGENYQCPPPELIDDEEEYEVEAILDSHRFGRGCKLQYLIKWLGYPESDNQWEDADKVHADEHIRDFQKRHPLKETHLRAGRIAKSTPLPFHPMSSPDSFTLELDITPVPVLDAVTRPALISPLLNPPGCLQTAPTLCGLTWTQALRLQEARMMREVAEFAWEQLLRAREKQDEKRRCLRVVITFRGEDLQFPLPTATATLAVTPTASVVEREGCTVTATTDAKITGTTRVGFETSTCAVPLTPTNVGLVTSPSTSANVTHSPSHRRDDPTSWQALVDRIRSSSTTSLLLSTQPLPALRVKKPLRFRELKNERKKRAKCGPLWRYVLDGEVTAEDKRRAEAKELALLEHHTPVMRHALHDFLTSSGSMSHRDSSPSTSGTMA